MKKIKFYYFASALLLGTAACLGSCASESDTEGGNSQQQNEAREVVKTQFVINIPYANGSSSSNARTRMTDENTQNKKDGEYNNFRGIENMILLTFAGQPGAEGYTTATNYCNISSDDNAFSSDNYRRLYRDIQIPVGTKYFILNGCAKRKATISSDDPTYFEEGRITPSENYSTQKELDKLTYSLVPIKSDANFSNNDIAKTIVEKLNALLDAKAEYGDQTTTTVNWKDLNSSTSYTSLGITDGERDFLIDRFTRLKSLTAGSTQSVTTMLNDLKEILIAGANDSDTQQTETEGKTSIDESKKLAIAIYNACTDAITKIGKADENVNFPRNLHLPDGVAKLKYSSTDNKFSYENASAVTIGENNSIDYTKICYPAELSYFVSTPAMISDSEINAVGSESPKLPSYTDWLTSTWTNATGFSDASDNSNGVTSKTKSVALKDPVQYSVACLKTGVKCNSAMLSDNAKAITSKYNAGAHIDDQDISVPSDGYKLTAILIGGQPASVNWDFYPASTAQFDHTIYDKDLNVTNQKSDGEKYMLVNTNSNSNYNYTLVLDNKNSNGSDSSQKTVYVTLEFENNGAAFYGQDGLVPNGGRFYLVGQLNPSALSGDTKTNTSGSSDNATINRVFLQDHTTIANFTIKNLKNAYNCIPDLRAAGVNVGLAVDLSWQEGITFGVDI